MEIVNRYLFDPFDYKRIGVQETDTYEIINNFYTKEGQEQYKALGIDIKLI